MPTKKKGRPIKPLNPKEKGSLHKALHVPEGKKIPASALEKAKHSKSAAIRKKANFAINAKKWEHGGKKKK